MYLSLPLLNLKNLFNFFFFLICSLKLTPEGNLKRPLTMKWFTAAGQRKDVRESPGSLVLLFDSFIWGNPSVWETLLEQQKVLQTGWSEVTRLVGKTLGYLLGRNMQSPASFSFHCHVHDVPVPGVVGWGNHPASKRPADQKDPIISLQGSSPNTRKG